MKKKLLAIDPQGRKVYMSSTRMIKNYSPFVRKTLGYLGHPEAWVSDRSTLSDFPKMPPKCFEKIVGRPLKPTDLVWAVAKMLSKVSKKNG